MPMTLSSVAFGLLSLLALAHPALAQMTDYPARPVKVIFPYAAGGFGDLLARMISQRLSVSLGQPFVVENRPSAGGVAAIEMVVKAPAGGYTLLFTDIGSLAVTPALMDKLPYDTLRDLAPITYAGDLPLFLVAHSSVPASTFAELVALIKSKPGQLNFGDSGVGSIHHLNGEAMKAAFGLDFLIVHYKGTAPTVPALLRGEVLLSFMSMNAIRPYAGSGRMKMLAVNSPKRTGLSPDTPTIAESGAPDFDYPAGLGMLAPASTPSPLMTKLSTEIAAAMRYGENQKRLTDLGFEVVGGTPEHFAALLKAALVKYARVVKASGANAN